MVIEVAIKTIFAEAVVDNLLIHPLRCQATKVVLAMDTGKLP